MQVTDSVMFTLGWLSDYGEADYYAGVLKGVALSKLTPLARKQTTLWEVSHQVRAFHINEARFVLQQTLPYTPAHTVLVCIVDPQVGSPQQRLVVAYRPSWQQVIIAPDNGLLQGLHEAYPDIQYYTPRLEKQGWWAWHYPSGACVGNTFAGRDVYTPLACSVLNAWAEAVNEHGLNEVVGEGVGSAFSQWCADYLEPLPLQESTSLPRVEQVGTFPPALAMEAVAQQTVWRCEVQYVDGFGNVVLTLPNHWLAPDTSHLLVAFLNEMDASAVTERVVLGRHYAVVELYTLMAVWGSHGYIELACNQASAQKLLNLQVGQVLWVACDSPV
jgi:S-adenosyl-L-methionine hydrolase (adenosine-forming)